MPRFKIQDYKRPEKNITMFPELSKLTDKQLLIEMQYEYDAANEAYLKCRELIECLKRRISIKNTVPLWRLNEDAQLHADRFQAITDEINYRQIP